MSAQAVRNLITKYSNIAGINKRITPHVFRHSFASLLLESGVDIKYIQEFLGHSTISTTQIYLHTSDKEKRKILAAKTQNRKYAFLCLWFVSCVQPGGFGRRVLRAVARSITSPVRRVASCIGLAGGRCGRNNSTRKAHTKINGVSGSTTRKPSARSRANQTRRKPAGSLRSRSRTKPPISQSGAAITMTAATSSLSG